MAYQDDNLGSHRQTDGWDGLKSNMTGIAALAKQQGQHFIEAARDQAMDYADHRKSDVAQSITDLASSLREATESFDERPNVQAIVDSAAGSLEHLAESIRERSIGEIYQDLEEVARAHPVLTAATSLAAGFLVARFIKSTARDLQAGAGGPSSQDVSSQSGRSPG